MDLPSQGEEVRRGGASCEKLLMAFMLAVFTFLLFQYILCPQMFPVFTFVYFLKDFISF